MSDESVTPEMAPKSVAERLAELRAHSAKQTAKMSKVLVYDGMEYEVRQLTVAERGHLVDVATEKKKDRAILSAIESTYLPGTDTRVWTDGSYFELSKHLSGGLVDCLFRTMNELTEAAAEKGKPSASAKSDS